MRASLVWLLALGVVWVILQPSATPLRACGVIQLAHTAAPAIPVEIASHALSRARGLANRSAPPAGRAMVLLYEPPRLATLTFRQTLVDLDVVFVAPDGSIWDVHPYVPAGSVQPVTSSGRVQAAIELAAGEAKRLGLVPGVVLAPVERYPDEATLDDTDGSSPCWR